MEAAMRAQTIIVWITGITLAAMFCWYDFAAVEREDERDDEGQISVGHHADENVEKDKKHNQLLSEKRFDNVIGSSKQASAIQQLAAPAGMISACGLLCLAMYNRFSSLSVRLRAQFRDRAELSASLSATSRTRATVFQTQNQIQRLIDVQIKRLRMIRNALTSLILCIFCMVLCSLAIGLSLLCEEASWLALGLFILGLLNLSAGAGFALRELACSLDWLQIEEQHSTPQSDCSQQLRAA